MTSWYVAFMVNGEATTCVHVHRNRESAAKCGGRWIRSLTSVTGGHVPPQQAGYSVCPRLGL